MIKREEVTLFLEKWKLATKGFIDFIPRQKNLQGLKELNLTFTLARKLLQGLTLENYVDGPLLDRDRGKRDIWTFGMKIENRDVYIKVKLFEHQGELKPKCLSFHPAEHPLHYFFSGGDDK